MTREVENKTLELMEMAQKMIQKVLPSNQYFDDLKWGAMCFEVNIFCDRFRKDGYPEQILKNTLTFYYDENDFFERTAEEQVKDAVTHFIERYYE